jgi:hypothetical protein
MKGERRKQDTLMNAGEMHRGSMKSPTSYAPINNNIK